MITESDVEKCLVFLRDTADDFAKWRARHEAMDYRLKIVESVEFLKCTQGSVDYKKAVARSSADYLKAVDDLEESAVESTRLYALRKTAEAKISAYQSQIKAHNQGLNL